MSQERIFISYARSDGEDFAKDLRQKLVDIFGEEAIWRDRDRLEGGKGWWQQIEEALETVDFMILIASPAAMESKIVRKEWRHARQQGVCVYPVKVPELPIDFATLPRWMSDAHFYTLDAEWENFIAHLRAPCQQLRVPFFGVPDLPDHFVERPDEFNALLSQLLDADRDNPVAITTSLTGAGGFGKTTLASALCHHDDVQTAFDDGVLWVTLGENPNVVNELSKIYRALTDELPAFVDAQEGASMLAEKLADRDILMVIDDVWNPSHLRPFLKGGERCARLITTRNITIATGANAKTNAVDEMETDQAVKMLLGGLETPGDIAPYEALAERLGEWALMLEIANSILKKRIALGNSLDKAREWVEKSLDKRGVMGIKRDDEDARKRSAFDVLDVSFELLDVIERDRLYQLAVFRDDSDIPLTSIMTRWNLDDFDSEELLEKFAIYSFIRFDAERQIVRIHDVVREVLESKLTETLPIEQAHRQLIDIYGLEQEKWVNWDNYTWQNIGYHLNAAEMLDELKSLLLNIDFLQAKLEQTNPNALIDDCDFFIDENRQFTEESLRLLSSAISMSSHLLIKESSIVPFEIQKSLAGYYNKYSDIANLLETIKTQSNSPQILPLHQTFRPAGGSLVRTLVGHSDSVNDVVIHNEIAISASGSFFGSKDNSIVVWNWRTGEKLHHLKGHLGAVNCLAIQDSILFSGSADKILIVWNWQTKERLFQLSGHSGFVTGVATQSDFVLSSSEDKTIIVWNYQTGEKMHSLRGHTSSVNNIVMQNKIAISASSDNTLIVWNWLAGEQLRKLEGHQSYVTDVAVQGEIAISASFDKTLIVWNWQTGELIRTLQGHSHRVNCILLQDHIAISGSSDTNSIVWNWEIDQQIYTIQGHTSYVMDLAIQDEIAVSASHDRKLIVWNWQTGELIHTLKGHSSPVNSAVIQDEIIISSSRDETLIVWNWQTGELIRTLKGHSSWINSIAIQKNFIISSSRDKTLIVWNWKTGKQIRTLKGHSSSVNNVAIQDEIAISASYDRKLIVWNWKTGERIRTLQGHLSSVIDVEVKDKIAISASEDKTLIVWNWQTGELIRTLNRHSDWVTNVAIENEIAISASEDKTLIVWNWEIGKQLAIFKINSPQYTVAIHDGVIVSGGEDGQVHFFQPNAALKKLLGW